MSKKSGMPTDDAAARQLCGRRILCIGGRTGLIDRYRRLVEASGGRFSHHDGGLELLSGDGGDGRALH